MPRQAKAEYNFYHESPETSEFHRDVINGLNRRQRAIPPKYFYDHAGSMFFEAICEQPEYYPTRTEAALLIQYAEEIAEEAGGGCYLIEPGSGSCDKVRHLLEAMRPAAYVPLDISCEHLDRAAAGVACDHPWLDVHAVCADITEEVALPFVPEHAPAVMFYPGSSIGNFDPDDACEYLTGRAQAAGRGTGLLIAVDLKQAPASLDAPYKDSKGDTAEFNQNRLGRINREQAGVFTSAA